MSKGVIDSLERFFIDIHDRTKGNVATLRRSAEDRMKQLPLFQRILFVDWHGVLSQDPFWMSIIHNSAHPLRVELEGKISKLFSRRATVHAWMKGMVSSQNVISEMGIRLDRRFREDFLAKRLDFDCAHMRVNSELVQALGKFKPIVPLVLATDNMDCFARVADRVRSLRRRRAPKPSNLILADWMNICDDIICSSDIGALKAEDPVGFFGPVLAEYGLRFSDALLIDDRADNCEAFRQHGGAAVQWKMGAGDIGEVTTSIQRWLGMSRSLS